MQKQTRDQRHAVVALRNTFLINLGILMLDAQQAYATNWMFYRAMTMVKIPERRTGRRMWWL
jgi:hypothetical protein